MDDYQISAQPFWITAGSKGYTDRQRPLLAATVCYQHYLAGLAKNQIDEADSCDNDFTRNLVKISTAVQFHDPNFLNIQ